MKCEPASKLSLVSGNYHEPAEPVVMVMASIDVKIRHVFADTPITEASIGSAPPGNNIAQWVKLGYSVHAVNHWPGLIYLQATQNSPPGLAFENIFADWLVDQNT